MLEFTPCALVRKKDGCFVRVRADSYSYISIAHCSLPIKYMAMMRGL